MGVALPYVMIAGMLYKGYNEQKQYKEQARVADQNAQIAYQNAERLNAQAETNEQNAAINEENKRRKLAAQNAQNITAAAKSGVAMTGSTADVMADNIVAQEQDIAMDRYNARQKTEAILQQGTDAVNQGDVYKQQAKQYRKAGRISMMNTLISTGLQAYGMSSGGGSWSKGDLSGNDLATMTVTASRG